jgi:predicted O-methyltransferase YrrM
MLKEQLKSFLNSLPYISHLNRELAKYKTWYPPGHYYNPLVDAEELGKRADSVFKPMRKDIPGVEVNEAAQLELLNELKTYYKELPFPEEQGSKTRYYLANGVYPYSDGIFLYLMMRHYAPKKIIEVGSGFSSAVMLDTNDHFFDGQINLTFVEPYPERLYSLLKGSDKSHNQILVQPVQEVPLETFEALEANDFLFIDSSHVSKTGSDVNYLFFEVLPRLKPGVLIHVHDIFTPFEYPKEWVLKPNTWFGFNELYLLRAFLMYNQDFVIVMFNTFLEAHHAEWFKKEMPLCLKNPGGSIWIQKVR